MNSEDALKILKEGRNVFLTGPPGTGKTYTLNKFIEYLRSRKVGVGVTASTGIAATHIEGQTIHSWSGMGINDKLTQKDIRDLTKRLRLHVNFKRTRVLIIDEISMLHARQLDMVDQISRAFKNANKPFGGMQVVLSGDFFQLPPVTKRDEELEYAFEAQSWTDLDLRVCYLTKQYRHTDKQLKKILDDIRVQKVGAETINILSERLDAEIADDEPLKLYTHNVDVDAENNRRLELLSAKEQWYEMESKGNPKLVKALKRGCLAPETLRIREGAQVMFVKNNPGAGFVNGTRGIVTDYNENQLPIVKVARTNKKIVATPMRWAIYNQEGDVLAEIIQVPLRLAWAVTVHKSQGLTLTSAEVDLSRAFDFGMGYVALSRIADLSGLKIINGINDIALMVSDHVAEYDNKLQELSESETTTSKRETRAGDAQTKLRKESKKQQARTDQKRTDIKIRNPNFRLERISPSMVSTYLFCPRQFYYEYIEKIELPWTPIPLLFGQAIHKAVEVDRNGNDMIEAFREIFDKNKLSSEDQEKYDSHITLGVDLLKEYEQRKDAIALTHQIVPGGDAERWLIREIENPATGEILELPLSFKYDYLMPGGNLVEYKTSKRTWNRFDDKVLLQTGLYAMGLAATLDEPVKQILYIVFVKDPHASKKIQTLPVEPTEEQMDAAFDIAKSVISKIKQGKFNRPKRHWRGCRCIAQEAITR